MKIVFTDIHFGKKNDSVEHNKDCLDFVSWASKLVIERNISSVVFMGDWHDSRSKIGIETLNYSTEAFDVLNSLGIPVVIIVGNHDMPYRETRKFHSLPWGSRYNNIIIVDEPKIIEGDLYVPYLVADDDRDKIKSMATDCEYVFGHFEFPGFLMNGSYEMPVKKDSLLMDDVVGPRYVFSGHFHARQEKIGSGGTIFQYIGNCFPHDFSDVDDTDRGVMFISPGSRPEYMQWPDAPSYHRIKVSRLEQGIKNLGKRAVVRAIPDVEITKSDRDDICKHVMDNYNIKSFSIDPVNVGDDKDDSYIQSWNSADSLDSFIVSWLLNDKNVSESMDRDMLVRLYNDARISR